LVEKKKLRLASTQTERKAKEESQS